MRGKMAFVGFGVCFTSLNKEQPPVQINSGFNNHSESLGLEEQGGIPWSLKYVQASD